MASHLRQVQPSAEFQRPTPENASLSLSKGTRAERSAAELRFLRVFNDPAPYPRRLARKLSAHAARITGWLDRAISAPGIVIDIIAGETRQAARAALRALNTS